MMDAIAFGICGLGVLVYVVSVVVRVVSHS